MKNYRPVSTLPIFGKNLKKVIYSRRPPLDSDLRIGFAKIHETQARCKRKDVQNNIRQQNNPKTKFKQF